MNNRAGTILLVILLIALLSALSGCSKKNPAESPTTLIQTEMTTAATPTPSQSLANTIQTVQTIQTTQTSETPQEIWPDEISNEEIAFGFRNRSSDLGVFENNGTLYFLGKLGIDSSYEENANKGLWKMDMDGSNCILLEGQASLEQQAKEIDSNYSVSPVEIINIIDERIYIYFYSLSSLSDSKIFSTDIQGQNMQYERGLTPEDTAEIDNPFLTTISDGINTYSIDEMYKVFFTDADGNKSSLFDIKGAYLNYQDGWIYFNGYDEISKEISIQCINIETGQKQVIYKTNDSTYNFQSINVCGNWVYYLKDFLLYRISTHGENNTLLVPDPISRVEVFGKTVFYYTCELSNPVGNTVEVNESNTLKTITIED